MKQILIQLDEDIVRRLEQVAPGRERKRSEFIRGAILRALWDAEEKASEEAYARQPDRADEAHFDPRTWAADRGVKPKARLETLVAKKKKTVRGRRAPR